MNVVIKYPDTMIKNPPNTHADTNSLYVLIITKPAMNVRTQVSDNGYLNIIYAYNMYSTGDP